MTRSLLLSLVVGFALISQPAAAALIATSNTFYVSLQTDSPQGNVDVYLAYSDPQQPNPLGMLQVFNVGLLEVALGTQVLMTGDMAGLITMMTNGSNNQLFIGATSGIDRSDLTSMEGDFFFSGPMLGMPDLTGASIDEVRVLLSSYSSGQNNEIEIGVSYLFYGTIPSPAAAWLIGLSAISARRRVRAA